MKKISAAAAALIGTLFFGILWLNNVVSAGRFYGLLFRGEFAGTDKVPSGFWTGLDWSTIDLSTVTTFVPFFGFALMFHRLFRPGVSPETPFFPGYDRFNIALGLIGTIWGIILVGYYPADQVSIGALMRCLHTAMFSTLIAVVWVMVLMPAVIVPVLRLCARHTVVDETELDELLDRITTGIGTAAEEFRKGADETAKFRSGLADAGKALRELRQEAASGREAEIAWQRSAAETLAAFSAAVRDLDSNRRLLREENEKLATENARLERERIQTGDTIRDLQRTIDQIRTALR